MADKTCLLCRREFPGWDSPSAAGWEANAADDGAIVICPGCLAGRREIEPTLSACFRCGVSTPGKDARERGDWQIDGEMSLAVCPDCLAEIKASVGRCVRCGRETARDDPAEARWWEFVQKPGTSDVGSLVCPNCLTDTDRIVGEGT